MVESFEEYAMEKVATVAPALKLFLCSIFNSLKIRARGNLSVRKINPVSPLEQPSRFKYFFKYFYAPAASPV